MMVAESDQWMGTMSIVQPVQLPMKFSREVNPIGAPPFITAGATSLHDQRTVACTSCILTPLEIRRGPILWRGRAR